VKGIRRAQEVLGRDRIGALDEIVLCTAFETKRQKLQPAFGYVERVIGQKPGHVRIPTIATTHSDGSRPAVPIDRDHRFRSIDQLFRAIATRLWTGSNSALG